MRRLASSPAALLLFLGAAACSSTAGPALINNDINGAPAVLNTTLGPLSYYSPENSQAVDETFLASSATLAVDDTNGAKSFNSATRTDFRTSNTVSFDASTNSLTFDIQQGDVVFQETLGPLLLRNPADVSNLENDTLAILLATVPDQVGNAAGMSLPDFTGDPVAADQFLIALAANDPVTFAALSDAASKVEGRDFFEYYLPDGSFYGQLKLTDNSGTTNTDYVALGVWGVAPSAVASGDAVYGTTVFGKNTPINDIPNTGSATYTGTLIGWMLRENKVEQMRGGVTIGADFAKNAVTFGVDAKIAINGPGGVTTYSDIAKLTGGGNIIGNRYFGGIASEDDPSLRGDLDGAFFGPQAKQTGGSLTFGNDEIAASGGFIGTRPDF